ncbi:anti sigma-E RseA, N-terminal domain protein [Collimonas fungivorans]|jgi:sigma-E factor negative regulatory protein RseA|uniref:Anti sigma-E RseA, N-terminal domain protein n=1 Tax=Collimonas fungivorans TaxID=158899 RepID=A0A127PEM5_9BURK|nr:sigma-E factor negative regulatory protein [Collimonas fungivorans]AMO96239.1 anti sigma-E RseA, N-terminal domain protein [Collimonas fungivorans]
MNTKDITQEQISALADGELSNAYVDMALAALRQADGRDTWDVYHQIGDIMRSDDMALTMSADFSARMAARLEAEPAIIAAPLAVTAQSSEQIAVGGGQPVHAGGIGVRRSIKRFALPGMAAAAVAAAAFIITPQTAVVGVGGQSAAPQLALASASAVSDDHVVTHSGVVLRDSRMDEYLTAHQRFSPSLYSAAQYARPATFAPDANN